MHSLHHLDFATGVLRWGAWRGVVTRGPRGSPFLSSPSSWNSEGGQSRECRVRGMAQEQEGVVCTGGPGVGVGLRDTPRVWMCPLPSLGPLPGQACSPQLPARKQGPWECGSGAASGCPPQKQEQCWVGRAQGRCQVGHTDRVGLLPGPRNCLASLGRRAVASCKPPATRLPALSWSTGCVLGGEVTHHAAWPGA